MWKVESDDGGGSPNTVSHIRELFRRGHESSDVSICLVQVQTWGKEGVMKVRK